MGQLMTEKDVLAKLGVKDFRPISKENIINFASMLQEMEPEVAIKALEQVPEFGKVTVAALEDYKVYAEKTLDCESAETQTFMMLCDKGIQALERCAASDDVTPEERMHDFCERLCVAAPHHSCGSCHWYAPFGTVNNLGSKGLYCYSILVPMQLSGLWSSGHLINCLMSSSLTLRTPLLRLLLGRKMTDQSLHLGYSSPILSSQIKKPLSGPITAKKDEP